MDVFKHIEIKEGSIYEDGVQIESFTDTDDFSAFAKYLYKQLEITYPKFYKMSNMSKLGFLATEFLLQNFEISDDEKCRVALALACKSSSLNTDTEYQKSIADVPSPALFVYTLPNIVTGEICIRNGFKGEEIMLVQEKFDREFMFQYAQILFDEGHTNLCVTGFIDYDENNIYFASLFLISNK
ncbi:MAG: hypothetical protein JW798_14230 [Prolixibacteraceae bacterium]|nr:hypothetical protein [Prolixibacteraceae bacterium]